MLSGIEIFNFFVSDHLKFVNGRHSKSRQETGSLKGFLFLFCRFSGVALKIVTTHLRLCDNSVGRIL